MLDFRIVKFMGVIFTPGFNISNSLKLANDALELLGERLDGSSSVLPVPQDAPAEIPRVQLVSKDKKWTLTISLVRTDLIHSPNIEGAEVLSLEEFGTIASKFFCGFKEKNDLWVQRLALITERLSFESEASYIVTKFCKNGLRQKKAPFSRVDGFQVHSLKKYNEFGFNINSWVRFKSVYTKVTESPIPSILMENDLNTFALEEDKDRSFSIEEIGKFFQQFPNHLEEIVKLYSF